MNTFTWLLLQESQKIKPENMVQDIIDAIHGTKIYMSDAVLSKLSKETGYNYLRDGYISFVMVRSKSDTSHEIIMRHWLKNVDDIDFSYAPKFRHAWNEVLYRSLDNISDSSISILCSIVDDNRFWKPHIDIAWLTGHYMKPICQLCDIDVICLEN